LKHFLLQLNQLNATFHCGAVPGGSRQMLPELNQGKKLLHVVEEWLRKEREERSQQQATAKAAGASEEPSVRPNRTPDMPLKHLMFFQNLCSLPGGAGVGIAMLCANASH